MDSYIVTEKDYKRFFNEKFEIKNEQDAIVLNVEDIKNKDDGVCEFSIKWTNAEDEEEHGIINHINTSSVFALMMCNWYEDCESD